MRPPDENQHGSTRPNLLSGARRHFGGDDNILERLERDSARHASGNRSRAAWYGVAASLILLLIVVVGWMAYERAGTVEVVSMKRAPVVRGPALVIPDASEAMLDQPPTPRPGALTAPGPAVITALPPEPVSAPARSSAVASLPPLVLLPAADATTRKPAAPVHANARPSAAPGPRPAAPVRATVVPAQQAASPRTAARLAPAGARGRKPATDTLSAEPVVDRDVALLSAIIIHDSAHAEEKAQLEAASTCARASVRKCQGDNGTRPGAKNPAR